MAPTLTLRDRNPRVERELTTIAIGAAGMVHDHGLRAFADHRALPGGVRAQMDHFTEAREELADCFNYLIWGAEKHYAGHIAGNPTDSDEYEWHMRALADLMKLWRTLHMRAA